MLWTGHIGARLNVRMKAFLSILLTWAEGAHGAQGVGGFLPVALATGLPPLFREAIFQKVGLETARRTGQETRKLSPSQTRYPGSVQERAV